MRVSPRSGAAVPAWRILLPAGLAELALLAALGWWPAAQTGWVRALLFGAAFIAYVVAAMRIRDALGGRALIWGTAVALRLVFLPLDPSLSGEAYRHLWDGHVQVEGFNPFGRAPVDEDLAGLRTPWFGLIPDAGSPTSYPPLAQLAFFAIALAGGALFQAKLLWIGLDLGTGWVLGRIAFHTGRSRRLTQLLWLWSPLLVIEVAWSGQMAPLALFPLCLVVLLARAPVGAGVAAGLSSLAAPIVLAALPALIRRMGRRFLVGFVAAAAVLVLPYLLPGPRFTWDMFRISHDTPFLEGLFALLHSAVPGVVAPRWVALVVILAVSAWATVRRLRPERALLWVLGAALLVTPVLRPWFTLWILPFAALRVSRPWLLFTALVFLAYAAPAGSADQGAPPLPSWIHVTVWLPFLAFLAYEAHRSRSSDVPLPLSPEG